MKNDKKYHAGHSNIKSQETGNSSCEMRQEVIYMWDKRRLFSDIETSGKIYFLRYFPEKSS